VSLLEVRHLVKWFTVSRGTLRRTVSYLKAVDDVSLDINEGKTFGLVGESGCGKTTLGRSILRLEQPTSGDVVFDGIDLMKLNAKELRHLRPRMQAVFQDPYSSLNPRLTVGEIVGEAVEFHGIARGRERRELVSDLLRRVGLEPSHAGRYPHEFSGGQRQRIGIARALAVKPKLVVCDEPVSALDVSVQSQILNLFQELQEEFKVTYLFIAHGLNVVKHVSDQVGVMYLGKIVEMAPSEELYRSSLHPYTKALISAIPAPNPRQNQERIILEGDVPSAVDPPSGCRFHTRCWLAREECRSSEPELREAGPGHYVACLRV
jgi:peptide/nickel transport system ATP-binding protein/oligopeptide transport system ATP-binding protein